MAEVEAIGTGVELVFSRLRPQAPVYLSLMNQKRMSGSRVHRLGVTPASRELVFVTDSSWSTLAIPSRSH